MEKIQILRSSSFCFLVARSKAFIYAGDPVSAEVSEARNRQKRVEYKRTQRFAVARRQWCKKHSCRLKTPELLFLARASGFHSPVCRQKRLDSSYTGLRHFSVSTNMQLALIFTF